jgi:hypothetical protein
VILADFRRLWATNFLEDLVIDVQDDPLAGGVVGKMRWSGASWRSWSSGVFNTEALEPHICHSLATAFQHT